jgi:ppGpp synthetase/RelA/SpoT-type nucleotidyltranferase
MQDIAGCRLIVPTLHEQDELVRQLLDLFPGAPIDDRRETPSFGYRAVHVLPRIDGHSVEIQVRTRIEDQWAELSEKLADLFGIEVKYGGGPAEIRDFLDRYSSVIALISRGEAQSRRLLDELHAAEPQLKSEMVEEPEMVKKLERQLDEAAAEIGRLREQLLERLRVTLKAVDARLEERRRAHP